MVTWTFVKRSETDTTLIGVMSAVLHVNIERTYVSLLAGLFVNFAWAIDFFVYYATSKEYRIQFDEYLHIANVKRFFGIKDTSTVIVYPTTDRHPKSHSQRT
ncbi:hypothetical protein KIN20_021431 [Parelaphostrongylus tenuis]|uniref:Uncharacterized protein n=1 Tax=Parelaphostrongylus tenuis TaxID=148309 RepID=A0AAD5QUL1_PARTN|nr:hypothetical protein KIN20_021431 [Parelaphostrongylus tenuis]